MKSPLFSLILVTTFVWFPFQSQGISRVGNGGLKSIVNGYSITVPRDYINIQLLPSENARMFHERQFFAKTPSIELRNFVGEFPELALKDKNEIWQYLADRNWSLIPNNNFCGQILYQETETTMAYILVWGQSKGYVLIANKASQSRVYLEEIIKSTILEKGACE